jgi:NAD-dependent deacetylase
MKSMTRYKRIVILTGAGISAESGIRTFRASDGLWENHRIEDVATPEGFRRNPNLVHQFYNQRRAQLKNSEIKPNAAHIALAHLEKRWEGDFLLVTQNVDNLHERAGSQRIVHMHGMLQKIFCEVCNVKRDWDSDLSEVEVCHSCQRQGTLRPDIVWFGELPYYLDLIGDALGKCELFISVGTSGLVYPAAGFAREAASARKIEVNIDETGISNHFHDHRVGSAGDELPKLVAELLGE